jgi:hypothetical protein
LGVHGDDSSSASTTGSLVGAGGKLFQVERYEVILANQAGFSIEPPKTMDLDLSASVEYGELQNRQLLSQSQIFNRQAPLNARR